MTSEAYPLRWPVARPRSKRRREATFSASFAAARDGLLREVRLLGGSRPVISTNVETRLDGLPYAKRRQPDDPAIAVYFVHQGRSMCFACDCWTKVEHNIQAIRKTIEALRGIARWGSGAMVEQAFEGFRALPPAGGEAVVVAEGGGN